MSWKTPFAALAGLAALAVAAPQGAVAKSPAEPGAKPARQCFWSSQIDGFNAPDDKTVYVHVGVRDVYRFEMFGPCHDVNWAQHIAIVSRGSNYICSGLDAEIIAPSSIGPHHCMVRNMTKLTPEEAKTLPKRSKP